MVCKTAKDAWNRLKDQFQGSKRTKEMQIMNLTREFEILRMKDSKKVKDYINKLMRVVNHIRLLGEDLSERRAIQKAIVSLPERFESTITSLERSKELSKLSLSNVAYAFQAAEQKRVMRSDNITENALFAKIKGKTVGESSMRKDSDEQEEKEKGVQLGNRNQQKEGKGQLCSHCKRNGHAEASCWFRPNVRCRSGSSNHMTPNETSFTELDNHYRSRVKIGNGVLLEATGKGLAVIQTTTGSRNISLSEVYYGRRPKELRNKLLRKAQIRVLTGYSLHSKAYKIYLVYSGKISISRNFASDKNGEWNWSQSQVDEDEIVDEGSIRGVRSILDICQRCQLAMTEPSSFEENFLDEHCVKYQALINVENEGEIAIIHCNKRE
ncbi:uncharacterized protein LOC110429402 [Herrania umbratica]|uniref:Uncharacterized protein LOC110429402 n=1 Tax=Herrania umbratica TaxID=108875 RepID=A0A6J1BNQ3_9ROSI|nr:uncharacterized protein LOC110429402 [Herrania umbratica]